MTFKAWHGDLKDGYAQKIEDPWDKRNSSQQKKKRFLCTLSLVNMYDSGMALS